MESDLVELVTRAAQGDEQAWTELVRLLSGGLLGAVSAVCRNRTDAMDVLQLTWLTASQRLGQLRDPAAVPCWLRRIATRHAIRLAARARRSIEPGTPLAAGCPERELLRAERDDQLWAAVAQLPDRYRRLVELVASQPSISYRQLAIELRMPVGSVGPLRARSFARLRRILVNRGVDPTDLS